MRKIIFLSAFFIPALTSAQTDSVVYKASSKEIKVEKKEIEKNKMGLLLAVNAGSHHEPRVVVLNYKGNPKSF